VSITDNPEYRKLRLDSSNDLIRHDARRGDGEYEQAALHARQAGLARQQMAAMAFAAGEYVRAASDWLSAAACFHLATDPERMRDALASAQQLEREGRIPAENRHVFAALREREEDARELGEKIRQFRADLDRKGGLMASGDTARLDWLLGRVRELPGYPWLHVAISFQARRSGQDQLADQHLTWAVRFEPENPAFIAEAGRRLIAEGYPDAAIVAGRRFMAGHPDRCAPVRFMLAEAHVVAAGGQGPDLETAVELLRPIAEDSDTRPADRLAALGLIAMLRQAVGPPDEFNRVLDAFDRLAVTVREPGVQGMVAQLHANLQRPTPNGSAAPRHPGSGSRAEPDLTRLFQEFVGRLAA
jgi:hypothetical protein